MSSTQTHDARMNFRLSKAVKERIERAASITGQSLSDFAASALARNADEILERHNLLVLADEEQDFFLHFAGHGGGSLAEGAGSRAASTREDGRRRGNRVPLASAMIIARLAATHDRKSFDCGAEDMNRYLWGNRRGRTRKKV